MERKIRKAMLGVLVAILLFLMSTLSSMTYRVKAQPLDFLTISSNTLLGALDGFQPVQVVWQWDYEALGTPEVLGDMVFKSFGQPFGSDVEWEARLPMVLGKNTYLSGTVDRNTIRFWVCNFYAEVKLFRLNFTILPDNIEFITGVYSVPGASFDPDTGALLSPGEVVAEVPAPIPPTHFQFKNAGAARIEVTLIGEFNAKNKFVVHVNVKDTNGLRILYVPLRLNVHPFVTPVQLAQMTTVSTDFIHGTYPMAENEIIGKPYFLSYLPFLGWLTNFGNPPANEQELEAQMNAIFSELARIGALANYDRVVGVLPPDWFATYWGSIDPEWITTGGLMLITNRVAVLAEEGCPTVSAHEIGHTYNLPDAPHGVIEEYNGSGNPAFGYWVNEQQYMDNLICFMGYAESTYASIQNWIDKGCFRHLLTREFAVSDPEILLVRGLIFKNNTASFDDILYRLPYGTPDIALGATGNYSVALLDEGGTIIAQAGFNVTFIGRAKVPIEFDSISLGLKIPWMNGTRQIQIRNATHVLASKNLSLNSPNVAITFPNGGEALEPGTNYTITWEASDPDGDSLTYSILYSNDNGSTWIPLAIDLPETNYNWNTAGFRGGSENLIKIIATDGINSGEDISNGSFTILVCDDIAITNVTPSKTVVGQGYSVHLNVTVANQGNYPETFDITLYVGDWNETRTIYLLDGTSTTITFTLNTTGFAKGNYTIWAYAKPVPDEINTTDNTKYFDGIVKVTIPGDVTGDFKVSMNDIVAVCDAFGSTIGADGNYWHRPRCILCPHNPNLDIDWNTQADMGDIVTALDHFGQHYP